MVIFVTDFVNDTEDPSAVDLGRFLAQLLMSVFLQVSVEGILLLVHRWVKYHRHPIFDGLGRLVRFFNFSTSGGSNELLEFPLPLSNDQDVFGCGY